MGFGGGARSGPLRAAAPRLDLSDADVDAPTARFRLMPTTSLRRARADLEQLVELIRDMHERVTTARNGKRTAVLM